MILIFGSAFISNRVNHVTGEIAFDYIFILNIFLNYLFDVKVLKWFQE